ncbi:MAG: hypothetical protein JNM96_03350 [Bacteroidia bacterium]|nr:hypothetical protein [Bacteroidia bacterium]
MKTTTLIILLLFTSFIVIGLYITSINNKYFNARQNKNEEKQNEEKDNINQLNTTKYTNKNNGWPDDYIDYSGGMLGL